MSNIISACPGCGVRLVSEGNLLEREFNASTACRELYYQLSYYTLSLGDKEFIHQLIVDAYAGQHYAERMKPITITFALIGLYLVNERNYTGRQVQLVHIALAKKSKTWPVFSSPQEKAHLTVQDVLDSSNDKKQEMIKNWSKEVWMIWQQEKNKLISLI